MQLSNVLIEKEGGWRRDLETGLEVIHGELEVLVVLQDALLLEHFTSEQPVDTGEGTSALVIGWDDQVNIPSLIVSVAQRHDGDPDIKGLSDGLLIGGGVGD